jgi:hypothetical protein
MTHDRDLERVLERWLADGPARMPDRLFVTVIDRVDRTPQRRLAGLATRYLTMPSTTRLTAIAAAVVIAVVAIGAWALAGPNRSEIGGRPTASAASPAASPSSSPSPSAPPIANGTYALAPMKVADLVAMINSDTKLSAADKTFLIDTAFAMKGGTTFNIWLDIDRGRFTERQAVDGVMNVGTQGTFTIPDDHTVIFKEQCACPPSTFQLTASGTSFTLHLLNPPTKEVDVVPVRTLWESGPFVRQP